MKKFQSTKLFDNYSVAIRQWRAQHSHCQLLHGYALKFKVWFESNTPEDENMGLDDMNWIVDYGGFKDAPVGNGLKSWMNDMWDHTTLIEKSIQNLLKINTKTITKNAQNLESVKLFKVFSGILIGVLVMLWVRAFFWDFHILV